MQFKQENDEGNIEYKLKLSPKPEKSRLEQLTTQMKFRLDEGNGECFYELGIADSGEIIGLNQLEFDESLHVLKELANECNADLSLIRKNEEKQGKWIAELLVRSRPFKRKKLPPIITIAMIGNVDSGKSTVIGTLLSNELDDGEGKNAIIVARHKHEIETGRTSSVSTRILGFNSFGEIVNNLTPKRSKIEVIKESSKAIRFVDLAGHEKYLKTTIFGLSGFEPDYACLVIDGNRGIQKMSKEHIGLATLALKIPIFVILTKTDLAPDHIYKRNITELKKLLKSPGLNLIPVVIKNDDDVSILAKRVISKKIVPILRLSCVSGDGITDLKQLLNLLKIPNKKRSKEIYNEKVKQPFLLFIDEVFEVTGVGNVVSGIIQSGKIETGASVFLGPLKNGEFERVRIRSIQTQRIVINDAYPSDYISMALSFKGKNPKLTKGMVLTTYQPFKSVRRFTAEVLVLHHPSTLRENYNAQVHIKTIRSQAKIVKIHDVDLLRSGDRAMVSFEFMYSPQFILPGMNFVFREGRTKGIGVITAIP